MSLIEANGSQWLHIVGIQGEELLELRLQAIGMMPGDCVRVLRRAPFGGPLLVEVNGRSIAIGPEIAAQVVVEPVSREHPCASS